MESTSAIPSPAHGYGRVILQVFRGQDQGRHDV
jgi:hypothetical protein